MKACKLSTRRGAITLNTRVYSSFFRAGHMHSPRAQQEEEEEEEDDEEEEEEEGRGRDSRGGQKVCRAHRNKASSPASMLSRYIYREIDTDT